jgi:pimeloyl-ACP methyl ester carboxylesterase
LLAKSSPKRSIGKAGAQEVLVTKIDLIVRQPLSDLPPEQLRPTPLLFVHGSWHGAWCWDKRFLEYFTSQGYTACAFSLRHHGDNPHGESGQGWRFTRFSHYLADLDQAVNELKLLNPNAAPVLIGHSLGGALVQKYLESRPAAGGVLLASVPPYGTAPAMLRFGSKYLFWLLLCIPTLDLYPVVKSTAVARDYLFSRLISYNEARKYHKLLKHESLVCYLQTWCCPLSCDRGGCGGANCRSWCWVVRVTTSFGRWSSP